MHRHRSVGVAALTGGSPPGQPCLIPDDGDYHISRHMALEHLYGVR
jgi:hypothetical protein